MSANPTTIDAVAAVEAIRGHFPALARRHEGRPVAYFDGPGGTQVPQVGRRRDGGLPAPPQRQHALGLPDQPRDRRGPRRRRARRSPTSWAPRPDEIAFGANMTTLTFHLARALGRALGAGRRDRRHRAGPPRQRRPLARAGAASAASPSAPSACAPRRAARLGRPGGAPITSQTRLLAIGAASNALGTINDVRRRRRPGPRRRRARVRRRRPLRRRTRWSTCGRSDCDFLACSAYKFYGPHVGVLWGRRDAARRPRRAQARAGARGRARAAGDRHAEPRGHRRARRRPSTSWPASPIAGARRRERLRAAFAARCTQRGQALVERLWAGPARDPGRHDSTARRPGRAAHADRLVRGRGARPSDAVARALAERRRVRLARRLLRDDGRAAPRPAEHGLVRAGCACYTTDDEVDRLLDGVGEIARGQVTHGPRSRAGCCSPSWRAPSPSPRRPRPGAAHRPRDARIHRRLEGLHRDARGPVARRLPEARGGGGRARLEARRDRRRHRRRLRLLRGAPRAGGRRTGTRLRGRHQPGDDRAPEPAAARRGVPNVQTILSAPDDPLLPDASVDLFFICDTWHHIDEQAKYLGLMKRMLKPGGQVVMIDFQKRELPVGPPLDMKIAREDVVKQMEAAGLPPVPGAHLPPLPVLPRVLSEISRYFAAADAPCEPKSSSPASTRMGIQFWGGGNGTRGVRR